VHVIATAGHVDHGKSTLVRALTGMEPDRWEAERRAGMTIDLGYAWTALPSGQQIAFVDVPGHERFLTNMLAGVGPAPAVMFVVAADAGWMPQSAEHLAAVDALGVGAGVLVITRSDLADAEPARRQAAARIAASSLGDVEAVAVSALTGQGLPELAAALGRLVARLPAPDPRGDVRLWLDRVFTVKGSGTVVTGTLQAGTAGVGDEFALTPSMRTVRVRGVQSLGAPAARVSGTARVALNLRNVSTAELSRGTALVSPGRWTVTSVLDVRLRQRTSEDLQASQPGGLPAQLTVHIGAVRVIERVRILGDGIIRLNLDHPLPLHVGDRVLLRDPGAAPDRAAGRPVYGATVLDVSPPRLRGNGAAGAAARELAAWPEVPAAPELLRRHRLLAASTAAAMGLVELPPAVCGEWLADPAYWRDLGQLLGEAVTAHAARDPLAAGLSVDAARAELRLPDRELVEALVGQGISVGSGPVVARGGYLRSSDASEPAEAPSVPELPEPVAYAVRAVLAGVADAPFSAPDSERLRELGLDARALAAATRAGLLLRLPGNVVLAADAPAQAVRVLAQLPQPFTAAEARQALRSTRRVVIPLLELLDRQGITRRLPDDRRTFRGT
jgi:selenocysteine-specific elongation factor